MRIACLTVLWLLMLAAGAHAQGVPLRSDDGNFKIIFPPGAHVGEPRVQTTATAAGDVRMTMYIVELNARLAYFVGYNDSPVALQDLDPKAVLGEARDGALRGVNGTKVSEVPYVFHGGPALSVRFTAPLSASGELMFGQANFMLVGNRLYQVLVLTQDQATLETNATKEFFDSFALLKQESK